MNHNDDTMHILGFDDNLGLPNDFSKKLNIQTKSYHDLSSMLQDFKQGIISLLFLPVGTLPYIEESYELIAQASFKLNHSTHIGSTLVTAKELTFLEVIHSRLGRINQYCTTSFWSPLIYFMDKTPEGTSLHFVDTNNGFEDLLYKAADKTVDAAMVWDFIVDEHPNVKDKIQVLGTKHNLPTPIIIANSSIPTALISGITQFKSNDSHSFFNGFTKPDLELIKQFKGQMSLANVHYRLGLSNF